MPFQELFVLSLTFMYVGIGESARLETAIFLQHCFILSCDLCMIAAPRSCSAEGQVDTSFFDKNTELSVPLTMFFIRCLVHLDPVAAVQRACGGSSRCSRQIATPKRQYCQTLGYKTQNFNCNRNFQTNCFERVCTCN